MEPDKPLFPISLAQWSLHRTFFGRALDGGYGKLFARLREDPASALAGDEHPLEFPRIARERFGIDAVEYVNTFFFDHAEDLRYLAELKANAAAAGVNSVLIMCDALGRIGDPDETERGRAVDRHRPWIDAAAFLGCHAIRVNAYSEGSRERQRDLVCDGLARLAEYAASAGISVLLENHGGLTSDAEWLVDVVRRTGHPAVGTLPDFGNFRIDADTVYDRYAGVATLMPFALGVSAKSNDFDDAGRERHTDFMRMLRIVLASGYRGYVGVEYEGRLLAEADGIVATRRLLERVRDGLAGEFASRP